MRIDAELAEEATIMHAKLLEAFDDAESNANCVELILVGFHESYQKGIKRVYISFIIVIFYQIYFLLAHHAVAQQHFEHNFAKC